MVDKRRKAGNRFSKILEAKNQQDLGNSLAVQWLGFCTYIAEGPGSIPGQGTKVLQTVWCSQKNKTKKNKTKQSAGSDDTE